MKDEEEGEVIQKAMQLIDSMIGRYKTEDEMKIGDREIDDLVEVKEKNH